MGRRETDYIGDSQKVRNDEEGREGGGGAGTKVARPVATVHGEPLHHSKGRRWRD